MFGMDALTALAAARAFEFYGTLPNYRAMMDREAVAGPGDLVVVGTEEQVRARIREIVESGATEFVGMLYTGGESATRTRTLPADLAGAGVPSNS
ncbi:hypothetical protein [Nocardia arthritidis]|nr:hypothetical protein [Nocardia arthritidis]